MQATAITTGQKNFLHPDEGNGGKRIKKWLDQIERSHSHSSSVIPPDRKEKSW